jgi:hypothetical protein
MHSPPRVRHCSSVVQSASGGREDASEAALSAGGAAGFVLAELVGQGQPRAEDEAGAAHESAHASESARAE